MSQRDFIPKANNFPTNKKPRLKLKTLQSGYEPDISTKNYPTMCVGYKQKTPLMWGYSSSSLEESSLCIVEPKAAPNAILFSSNDSFKFYSFIY